MDPSSSSSSSWSFFSNFLEPTNNPSNLPHLSESELPQVTLYDSQVEEAYQEEVKKQGEDYKGEDHLIRSASKGDLEMCRHLISFHGVDPFYELPHSFQRALTVAMDTGRIPVVKFLQKKMLSKLPNISIEERFSNEKNSKGEVYDPNFHLLQACTYDDIEMARFLISKNYADPLFKVSEKQQGLYGFQEGDSAMIVGTRYGCHNITEYLNEPDSSDGGFGGNFVDFLKDLSVPNLQVPKEIASLQVKIEADERLMELGAFYGDPLNLDVAPDLPAEKLHKMVVTRLCEPSGGRRSPYPERKKSTEVIQMSGFDFEEDGLESMEDEALKQAEMVQKIVSGWKLIEFDEGEPIWHRGRQLSPMDLVHKYTNDSCGLFLAFKMPLPQFKFVVNYPSSSLVVPGEEYIMYVDCFDPEDEMKPSVLVGRLQLIIVDELEYREREEKCVEMTPEGGRVGRYIARWVPQHPGLYFAMTRANGVNVHDQWAKLTINEDKGLTSVQRKITSLFS